MDVSAWKWLNESEMICAGGLRFYSDISLEKRTVKNLRAGV